MDLHTGDITRDTGRGADAHGDTIVDRTETTVTRTVDRAEIDEIDEPDEPDESHNFYIQRM